MRSLLDTHVLLWARAGHPKIKRVSARLLDDDNQVFFSVACLWEVALALIGTDPRPLTRS